jgi:hypothetical protein
MTDYDQENHYIDKLEEFYKSVKSVISENNREYTESYLNAGEWSLAFEVITGSIVRHNLPISANALLLAEELVKLLDMEGDDFHVVRDLAMIRRRDASTD